MSSSFMMSHPPLEKDVVSKRDKYLKGTSKSTTSGGADDPSTVQVANTKKTKAAGLSPSALATAALFGEKNITTSNEKLKLSTRKDGLAMGVEMVAGCVAHAIRPLEETLANP